MIADVLAVLSLVAVVAWLLYEAIQDFVLQPRRDAEARQLHWCSGCDRCDIMRWDMAWTEDHGRWWCRKCRTSSGVPA